MLDTVLLIAVLAVCAFWMLFRYQRNVTPTEDALMLYRYARNLANGYGVRWNIGDAPVDGATDFLFMAATAGLARIAHIGVIAAGRILILTSQVLSVAVLFAGARRLLGANRWIAAAFACYLCAGPAVKQALGGFAAPCLGLFVLCCWCAAVWYAGGRPTWVRGLPMAAFGLLAGLTRPEGVLITGILWLALAVLVGWRRAVPALVSIAAVFALLGGPYFLWRWHYFGYPLPNPFYIKGGGHLYPDSVVQASINLSVMLAPAMPLLPLGWLSRRTARITSAIVVALVCFALMWGLLNNWNNHMMRFQYSMVPAVLFTMPAVVARATQIFDRERMNALRPAAKRILAACLLLATVAAMSYFDREFPFRSTAGGMRDFARRIAPLGRDGSTMVVTEAGALPFYSQWRVIDALGLNDEYIAHHGGLITPSYLAQQNPAVIMLHADLYGEPATFNHVVAGVPLPPGVKESGPGVLATYARAHGYLLGAALGASPCNLHMYYIRPDWAGRDAFLHQLRDVPMYWLDSGVLTHDYRDHLPPFGCGYPTL